MKERDAWWAYLTGRPESEWNPAKKSKRMKSSRDARYDSYGAGMRAFRSEYEVQYDSPAAELSYTAEEGEILDPTTSLPTPFGTPVPPENAHTKDQNGTSNDASSSTNDTAKPVQPEPTPSLLRHLDHVSVISGFPCNSTLIMIVDH